MRHDMRDRLTGHDVCPDCYMAYYYGPNGAGIEYGPTWDRDRFGETVNSIAERGEHVYDGTCSDHDPGPVTYDDDGNETTAPCTYCGETDPDNGHTTFSTRPCETCGDHLAGERYRLLVG